MPRSRRRADDDADDDAAGTVGAGHGRDSRIDAERRKRTSQKSSAATRRVARSRFVAHTASAVK